MTKSYLSMAKRSISKTNTTTIILAAFVGICSLNTGFSFAIESAAILYGPDDPASISAGSLKITPELAVQVGHDDNLFTTRSNKTDSLLTILHPSVKFLADKGNDSYNLTYTVEDGTYHDSNADNYTDHDLRGEALLELNSRNHLDLKATYLKEHETRGSTDAASGDKPSLYQDKMFDAKYRYGAKEARGAIEVKGSYLDRRYVSFEPLNASRDRENWQINSTFFYRVAPKTSLVAEARHEDIDYDLATSTQDSTERKYFVGATGEATAKTSGTAKFGYSETDYDSASREDQDGDSWEVEVKWEPQTYSTFTLATAQEFEESDGIGDGIDTESLSLSWEHYWKKRLSTTLTFAHEEQDYINFDRNDETDNGKVRVQYDMRRWLSISLEYAYTDADSNIASEQYKRNEFMLTVSASL